MPSLASEHWYHRVVSYHVQPTATAIPPPPPARPPPSHRPHRAYLHLLADTQLEESVLAVYCFCAWWRRNTVLTARHKNHVVKWRPRVRGGIRVSVCHVCRVESRVMGKALSRQVSVVRGVALLSSSETTSATTGHVQLTHVTSTALTFYHATCSTFLRFLQRIRSSSLESSLLWSRASPDSGYIESISDVTKIKLFWSACRFCWTIPQWETPCLDYWI